MSVAVFASGSAPCQPLPLEYSYIYPPVESEGGGGSGSGGSGEKHGILFRGIDLDLRYRVHPASFQVTLRITSRWDEQVEFEVAWVLGADFAGLSEVQAGERQQEAEVRAEAVEKGVLFQYVHKRWTDSPVLAFLRQRGEAVMGLAVEEANLETAKRTIGTRSGWSLESYATPSGEAFAILAERTRGLRLEFGVGH